MPGGKVGGIGDVIRELPPALCTLGWPVTVLTPSYGSLHKLDGAARLGVVMAKFRGTQHEVGVFSVPGSSGDVRYIVLDHALLTPTEPGVVYHSDTPDRPYATDADKFSFFCAAVAAWIESLDTLPAAIHLHDWHTGFLPVLRAFDPSLEKIKNVPIFFTIHNLSYQGQRPMSGDESSLEAWFPDLDYDSLLISEPGDDSCCNPMAAAIRLADRVNTVSPSYAREILRPSDPDRGFIGGEGLEADLQDAATSGRLVGILNGCDYGIGSSATRWTSLRNLARKTVLSWASKQADSAHQLALQRIAALPARKPLHLLTSVGRIVDQKMRLFLEPTNTGLTALEDILDNLGKSGLLFLLGSGEPLYERKLVEIAAKHSNLVFFRGYSEDLGNALYNAGDLFLMPSSFEPCGISQMLAMREGQPCAVHKVGGLRDTVEDGVNGFTFGGDSPRSQASNFVATVDSAVALRGDDPVRWHAIRDAAALLRFDWKTSAQQYVGQFYEHDQR